MTPNPFSSWSRPRSAVAALSILSLGALSVGCTLVVPASRRTADFGGQDAPTADVPTPDAPIPDVPGLDAPDAGAPDVPADVPPDVPGLDAPCTLVFGYADLDGDSYGAGPETSVCVESGATLEDEDTDCDDADRDVHPGAAEACDGVDSDCDRVLDEDDASLDAACGAVGCVATGSGASCDEVAEVEAGWFHTCVRYRISGAVWCWGQNTSGQLGPAATLSSTYVAPFDTGIDGASDLCLTDIATCYIRGQLVRCVGGLPGASGGEIGETVSGWTPVEIACGSDEVCVRGDDGSVWCMGSNSSGQGGAPTSMDPLTSLHRVTIAGATGITLGANFSCAVDGSGAVSCWGANDSGQLGRGTMTTNEVVPVPISLPGVSFASVEAMNFAACARTEAGAVYCWGPTFAYEVVDHAPGAPVLSPATTSALFASLHGGPALHACGVGAGGSLACWGNAQTFALGRGGVSSASPSTTSVVGSVIDVAVASGPSNSHTCALTVDHRVHCWGGNSAAQCGAPASGTPIMTAVEVIP